MATGTGMNRRLTFDLPEKQSEADRISDAVYAAMQTGNHGRARTILTEYSAVDKVAAERLHASVIGDYGVVL